MQLYAPGTCIAGRYEVAGRPMLGGMGIVYACLDLKEDRPVALKTFRPEHLPDRTARDRFLREGTHWVELGAHPHIVRCYQVFQPESATEVYLVLELVAKEPSRDNASLRAWMTPGVPLTVEQAILFALQIARGMLHAVETIPGFVHRDLKPENVLVGADRLPGESAFNRLRVTDFGLASVLQASGIQISDVSSPAEAAGALGRTQLTRGVVGTPRYMAPEQWRGEGVTVATDIYALGCILYEMVSGQQAMEGRTLSALCKAHCERRRRPLPRKVTTQVSEVINRCLAIEPRERYGSWAVIEAALETAYHVVSDESAPALSSASALSQEERVANGWSYNAIGLSYIELGKADVAASYFERVVTVATAEENMRLAAAGMTHLGMAYEKLGEEQHAISLFQKALAIDRAIRDREWEGLDLGHLGNAFASLGDARTAVSYHEQALAISRETADRRAEGVALGNLGNTFRQLGDARQASSYHGKALLISRQIGDKRMEAQDLTNLGIALNDLGDTRRAVGRFEQALAIAREIGDPYGEGGNLDHLGIVCTRLGNPRQAIAFHLQALAIFSEIGDRRGEMATLNNLAVAYFQVGEIRQAINHYEQQLVITREIGDRYGEGVVLSNLGGAYRLLGDLQHAMDCHDQALAITREIGDRFGEGVALNNMGIVYSVLGDIPRAVRCYEQRLVIAREIGDRQGEGLGLMNLANSYSTLGDRLRAVEYYRASRVILEEIGDVGDLANVDLNLAGYLLEQGCFDDALAHAQRAQHAYIQIGHPEMAQRAQQLLARIRAAWR